MKTKQSNLTNVKCGIYEDADGNRLKVVGFGFLNGFPFVNWFWTNIKGCDKSSGTTMDGFESFIKDFKLIKECDLTKYRR